MMRSKWMMMSGAAVLGLAQASQATVIVDDFSATPYAPSFFYGQPEGSQPWNSTSVVGDGSQISILAQSTGGMGLVGLSLTPGAEDTLVVDFTLNAGNVATSFNVMLIDGDGTEGVAAIDLSSLGVGTHQFTTPLAGLAPGPFNAAGADGIYTYASGSITGYQVQGNFAPFPVGVTLDISVDQISTTGVPEPASLGLLGLGGLAMAGRRKH